MGRVFIVRYFTQEMAEWLKKRRDNISGGLPWLKKEIAVEAEVFDSNQFIKSIDNAYRAVKEEGVCPSRAIIEKASEKWNGLDKDVKRKLGFIAGKCK